MSITHTLAALMVAASLAACTPEAPSRGTIVDFGAVADDSTINTQAIQAAIDAAHAKPEGDTVVVPAGVFLSGTLFLKSNVVLWLDSGAVLKGSPHLADYPVMELTTTRSYTERYTKKGFIYAEDQENIAILGSGTIDGNSDSEEFVQVEDMREKPLGIKLVSCRGVRVEGVTLRQAGLWLQHYLNCEDLTIRGITAYNHGHFTNDGMNIDGCRRVLIEDVRIDSHDDALVFKSTGPAVCEDVKVRNVYLRSHCHGLKFGTETTGGFYRVDIEGVKIEPSAELHPKSGKLWPVNTGMALEITDGGTMQDVRIAQLEADSVYGPIFVKLGNRARKHRDDAPTPTPGTLRRVTIEDVTITNAINFTSSVTGFPGHPLEDVTLRNVSISYSQSPPDSLVTEEVPENETFYPEITMFTKKMKPRHYLPTYGLFARHVDGLTLENFSVTPTADDPRQRFVFDHVENLVAPGIVN